ncbi:MAG TPA: DNA mismatch repair protein MutS, partial [Chlamydiales bacterium]|nr:DNA mismatch repair protein MutS [Chlamydiales bacterium]
MEHPTTTTPMMAQWEACKEQCPGAVLLFRLGDFYEAFHEDAVRISKDIGLTLTARQGTPMCGIPFHTSDSYIDKLVAKGYKVAVAEQVEDPKTVKGLVKREVVRIISPGTLINSNLLVDKKNNYFASVAQIGSLYGLGALDVSTGDLRTLETEKLSELFDELHRIRPSEILVSKKFKSVHPTFFSELSYGVSFFLTEQEDWRFEAEMATSELVAHFPSGPLPVSQLAVASATGALLGYLKQDLRVRLEHVTQIRSDSLEGSMSLDHSTLKNLGLVEFLLPILDQTATPMGARLLNEWIKKPLLSIPKIANRQKAIAEFLYGTRPSLVNLKEIRDLERLMMKIQSGYGSPRDLLGLGISMSKVLPLKKELESFHAIAEYRSALTDSISSMILSALTETPPLRVSDGGVFQDGYHSELDRLRTLSRDSISWMNSYQLRLREETGIRTLKVGYTNAFGYYIEVSRAAGDKIPAGFQRQQTLVNTERFITEELKQFEHQALSAEERSKALEAKLFEDLRAKVATFATSVQQTAQAIAHIDALVSLSIAALENRWTCPTVDSSDVLEIQEGRHPVVEQAIGRASFIANDTSLNAARQLMLITGPNMAGKSTYIRQVALLVILAQMGSYVPARFARVGLVDKIFSRIGASDDLARGQSTFMVEMTETANILNNATSRSLVLLDEIGRGTSTYDGIAIAWSVAEYLLTTAGKQAKTLFATHYSELTKLSQELPKAINYQV